MHDVQRAGHALFDKNFEADDPIGKGPYFASTIFVKTIENMLSVDGTDDLLVDKDLFTYANADGQIERHGGTMLYLIHESGPNDKSWNGCAP